ncbi:MAG: outer membrane beta-barrel protein [Acidiferrobacterales bacterium]
MNRFSKSLLAASIAACASAASAADKAPTLADVLKASELNINGYVDTSYSYLTGSGAFTSGTADRVFDTQHNAFNLHALDLTASYVPASGFGGLAEVSYGTDGSVTSSAGLPGTAGAGVTEVDVQQGYLQYAGGPVTVMAGKFVTLAGAEVIRSPSDLNFSRGILFGYAIPFTHTGVRVNYAINSAYNFTVGVNNGWDTVKPSATGVYNKTLELGFAATPIKPLIINADIYSGDAPGTTATGINGRRDLLDLVVTYNVTDALSFALNGDYGQQVDALAVGSTAKWDGVAAYTNYNLSSMWRVAGRLEYFDDKDGFRTGLVQKWKEGTVTLAFMPTVHTELRGEVRYDKSDQNAFSMVNGAPKDSQSSVGVEGLYKF